jgi:enoyl-CoA hydratase
MTANSPLSMAATLEAIRRLEGSNTVRAALELEYRYAARSFDQTDFLEGIRARILDKDNAPRWRHASPGDVAAAEVDALFAPLGTGVPPLVF